MRKNITPSQNILASRTSGQALIMLVVLMGGMLMMATAIAGLLTFYQLQQAGDTSRSTAAIYAADAGLERAAYFYSYEYIEDTSVPAQYSCDTIPCTAALGGPYDVFDPFINGTIPVDFRVLDGTLPNNARYAASVVIPAAGGGSATTIFAANGFDAGDRTVRSMQIVREASPSIPTPPTP
jgi:hypothetical protein